MLNKIVEISLRYKLLVLVALVLIVLLGARAWQRLPLDAFPDVTPVQVNIYTESPGLAAEDVEKLVTFPIESEMAGLPDMVELRSLSKFGLSQVTMTFRDGIDLYRVRQLVTERLSGVLDELPPGLAPKLAPVATGLGEIFYYSLDYAQDAPHKPASREEQLMALGQLQEYQVKPLLRGTKGVAEVNTSGGYEKQIVIQPDPARLAASGLSLDQLAAIVEQNTLNAGGGFVEIGGEQLIVRATTRVTSIEEIAGLPLKFTGAVKPLLLSEVATVGIGSGF